MAAWENIAATLRLLPQFGVNKDGKACYSRFMLLVRHRRDDNTDALRRSGSAEQYEEKETLLNDIILRMDAHHADVALASSQRQERTHGLKHPVVCFVTWRLANCRHTPRRTIVINVVGRRRSRPRPPSSRHQAAADGVVL
ncbi:TPA: hypothetical protein N0F65_000478 [Lagenidium giganteum]|uniref:Uncharacterized protein n=1 Tax=Lagenidium giganteum TaxID=4803 RepID=A0AAV2Z668_9STRA|nr:TPA: hypothetical protein N0F65_000478 [Lagenidium giganteum]